MINLSSINDLIINNVNESSVIFNIVYDNNFNCVKKNSESISLYFSSDLLSLQLSNVIYDNTKLTVTSIVKDTNYNDVGCKYDLGITPIVEIGQQINLSIDYNGVELVDLINGNITLLDSYTDLLTIDTVTPTITSGSIYLALNQNNVQVISNIPISITSIKFYDELDVEQTINISSFQQNGNILTAQVTTQITERLYFKIDLYDVLSTVENRGNDTQNAQFFTSTVYLVDTILPDCSLSSDKQFVKQNDTFIITLTFLEETDFTTNQLTYDDSKFNLVSSSEITNNIEWSFTFSTLYGADNVSQFNVDLSDVNDNYGNHGVGTRYIDIPIINSTYPSISISGNSIVNTVETFDITVNTTLSNDLLLSNFSTSSYYTLSNLLKVGNNYTIDITPNQNIYQNNLRISINNSTINIGNNTGNGVSQSNYFTINNVIPQVINVIYGTYNKLLNTLLVTFVFNTEVSDPTASINISNIDGTLSSLTSSNNISWLTTISFNSNNSIENYFTIDNFGLSALNGQVGSSGQTQFYGSDNIDISNGLPHATITVDDLPIAIFNKPLRFNFVFNRPIYDVTFVINDITFPRSIGRLSNFTEVDNKTFYVDFTPIVNDNYNSVKISLNNALVESLVYLPGDDVSYCYFSIVKTKFNKALIYKSTNFKKQRYFSSFTSSNYIDLNAKEKRIIKNPIPIVGFKSKFETVILSGLSVDFITKHSGIADFNISSGIFLDNNIEIPVVASSISVNIPTHLYMVLIFYFEDNIIKTDYVSILDVKNTGKKLISVYQYVNSTFVEMVDFKLTYIDIVVNYNNQLITLTYNESNSNNSQILYGNK